jgi:hypothetical protein
MIGELVTAALIKIIDGKQSAALGPENERRLATQNESL